MILNKYAHALAMLLCLPAASFLKAQGSSTSPATADTGTTYDLFLMPGSDFVRPGLGARTNLNIGLGHTFAALHKDPLGDEVTFAYTYEDAGSHGFWHSDFGAHTETAGIMRNFNIPRVKALGAYTWVQVGVTSLTGNARVQNRFLQW